MDIQIVIAVAVVAALAYFFVFKKKADVNNDGQVNAARKETRVEKPGEFSGRHAVAQRHRVKTDERTMARILEDRPFHVHASDRVGPIEDNERNARLSRRAHDAGAFRDRHVEAVDGQRDHFLGTGSRGAEIAVGKDEVFHLRHLSSGKVDGPQSRLHGHVPSHACLSGKPRSSYAAHPA